MSGKTVPARVLLGWMERDEAIHLLCMECAVPGNLSRSDAEELWVSHRDKALQVQRPVHSALRLPFTAQEEAQAREATRLYKETLKIPGFRAIVKLDPLALVPHQTYILTERAATFGDALRTPEQWFKEAITPPRRAIINATGRSSMNAIDLDVPHPDVGLVYRPGAGFAVWEYLRYVAVAELPGEDRTVLWNGHHRVFARVQDLSGEEARSALLAVEIDPCFDGDPSGSGGRKTYVHASRPPLVSDFFTEGMFLPVRLKKKRFELQIRAHCVAIDDGD